MKPPQERGDYLGAALSFWLLAPLFDELARTLRAVEPQLGMETLQQMEKTLGRMLDAFARENPEIGRSAFTIEAEEQVRAILRSARDASNTDA